MLTIIVTPSMTMSIVSDMVSPEEFVPPRKYSSNMPIQDNGGPGSAGNTLPKIPIMPANTASTGIRLSMVNVDRVNLSACVGNGLKKAALPCGQVTAFPLSYIFSLSCRYCSNTANLINFMDVAKKFSN